MRMVTLKEKFLLNRAKANELSGVKTLNFWGAQLSDVSLLREVPNAEVINASANDIEYLEPFSHCTRLKELYLRKNNIKDIKQVLHLKKLTNLRYLWLSGNPFCEEFTDDEYRLFVLKTLPQLKKLDNITVTTEQLKDAVRCGYDVIKGSSYVMSSTSSSSGEMLSPIIPPDDPTIEDEIDFQPSKLVGDINNRDDVVKSSQNPDEQDPKLQDPDEQDPKLQNPDEQDPKLQNPDEQDPKLQNPDEQDPKLQNPDGQDPKLQDPSPQDLERSQDPSPQDPKPQDPDEQDPKLQDPKPQDLERSQDPSPQDPDPKNSNKQDPNPQDPDKQDVEKCEDTTCCSYVRSSLGNVIVEDPNPSSNNVDSTSTKQHHKSSTCDSTIDNSSSCKDVVIEGEANMLVNNSPSIQCDDGDAAHEVKNIGKFSPTKYDEVDEKLATNLSLKEEVELSSLISTSSCTNPTSPVTQHHPLVSAEEPSSSSSICGKVETEDNEILDEMNKIRAEFGSKPLTAEKFYSSNQKISSRMSSTRKKKKKNNLLTATLALVDELNEENLYLVKEQIEEKLQQISSRNISVMMSSSTSSLDQSIGEISCLDEV